MAGASWRRGVLAEGGLGARAGERRFRHGFDLAAWVEDPDAAPPEAYLRWAAISYPLNLSRRRCCGGRCGPTCSDAAPGSVVALRGHSQGLLAALLVAEAARRRVEDALLARYVRRAAVRGRTVAEAAGRAADGGGRGCRARRLEALLAATPDRWRSSTRRRRIVVGGPPADTRRAAGPLTSRPRRGGRRGAGARGGAPLRFEWTPLPVDVAFHTPALAEALARFAGARRPGRAGAGARVRAVRSRARPVREPGALGPVARRARARRAPTGCSTSARAPTSRG